MHEHEIRPRALQPLDRPLAAVRAAVIHDPEHAAGGGVRLAAHDLLDEAAERFDPACGFAAADHPAAAHVPRGEIFTEDFEIGSAATEAVRMIETRMSGHATAG